MVKKRPSDWRDGSAVKSIACSARGPEFNFQQPHGGSQASIMKSGMLFWRAGMHAGRTLHINKSLKKMPGM